MKRSWGASILVAGLALLNSGCGDESRAAAAVEDRSRLVGAWRAPMKFKAGPLAALRDLEFMFVFNEGGTMMQSSNYDGAPPVPPAYGVWKKVGPRQFQAQFAYYQPAKFEKVGEHSDWVPSGRALYTQMITLSDDNNSFVSQLTYLPFDRKGKPMSDPTEAQTIGSRMDFESTQLEEAQSPRSP